MTLANGITSHLNGLHHERHNVGVRLARGDIVREEHSVGMSHELRCFQRLGMSLMAPLKAACKHVDVFISCLSMHMPDIYGIYIPYIYISLPYIYISDIYIYHICIYIYTGGQEVPAMLVHLH